MLSLISILHRFAGLGLPFIAIISFLSNCVPYLTIPYLALVFVYISTTRAGIFLTVATILVSSIFAALGKVVVYYIGRGMSKIVLKNISAETIELFNKLMDKGIFLAIFIFAASPLPDDVLYIPVGVLKYSPIKFFVACFAGKIVITSVVAFSGEFINFVMSPIYAIILSIVATVIVLVIMKKINWEKLVQYLVKYGFWRTIWIFITRLPEFFRK